MLDMTEEGFGSPLRDKRVQGKEYKDSYVEGPWLTKRNGTYQLLYAAGGVPEHISYSTAPSPLGPWKYAGEIMPLCDTKSFTNHLMAAASDAVWLWRSSSIMPTAVSPRSCLPTRV